MGRPKQYKKAKTFTLILTEGDEDRINELYETFRQREEYASLTRSGIVRFALKRLHHDFIKNALKPA